MRLAWYQKNGVLLVEQDLCSLGEVSKSAARDEGKLRAAIEAWKATGTIPCPGFQEAKPIEGKPYERKMWEAWRGGSARSDGVHGYRIFYTLVHDAKTSHQTAVLLRLFPKKGKTTPPAVLKEAWELCTEVRKASAKKRLSITEQGVAYVIQ